MQSYKNREWSASSCLFNNTALLVVEWIGRVNNIPIMHQIVFTE